MSVEYAPYVSPVLQAAPIAIESVNMTTPETQKDRDSEDSDDNYITFLPFHRNSTISAKHPGSNCFATSKIGSYISQSIAHPLNGPGEATLSGWHILLHILHFLEDCGSAGMQILHLKASLSRHG
ncbi:hypothetical protein A0H81_05240 [Grifola frondosa]|uniref:Uncharacterized protein n=1 Tax=Grifola frondosa TaxID=5627 RepID=A0A1C7MD36_GRIFR|nr:hypothetical protein A0H81_05240 [Grifola frondosa]